jgi:hypothetical protein
MTQVISPTPGRIVWYTPTPHDGIATLNDQPLAAIVAGVHNDRLVNLAVFDSYGNTQQRSNVTLVQPGEDAPNHAHATWMPYQVGQAAKTEQAKTVADVLVDLAKDFADQAASLEVSSSTSGMFADTDGTSASEIGLVANEAAPSSSEPAQA